jgi:hypothetical protein
VTANRELVTQVEEGALLKSTIFKTFLVIDILIAAIVVFFYFWGLADQSVSSDNMGTWVIILVSLVVIIGGGLWLKKAGHQ